jgi:hypothetical protein
MRVSNRMILLGLFAAMALPAAARSPVPAGVPAAQATPPASSDAAAAMMRNMQTMHEQMAKLRATTDPGLRARLLDEHLATMQATMQLMMANHGGCPAGGMMGRGAMGGHGMMGAGGGNMMQLMMEQMRLHQDAMHGHGADEKGTRGKVRQPPA